MKLRIFVSEYEAMPKGYGIAYREIHRAGVIAYPLPINLIVMGCHHLWVWMVSGGWDVLCDTCYKKGLEASERLGLNREAWMKEIEITQEIKRKVANLQQTLYVTDARYEEVLRKMTGNPCSMPNCKARTELAEAALKRLE